MNNIMFLFPMIFHVILLFLQNGVIIHEMMHAIGSWHEQSRQDRDSYMTVIWDNIPEGAKSNYYISQTYNNTPFDPSSNIMYGIYVSVI